MQGRNNRIGGVFWNENLLKKISPPYMEDGELAIQSVKHQVVMADLEAPSR